MVKYHYKSGTEYDFEIIVTEGDVEIGRHAEKGVADYYTGGGVAGGTYMSGVHRGIVLCPVDTEPTNAFTIHIIDKINQWRGDVRVILEQHQPKPE